MTKLIASAVAAGSIIILGATPALAALPTPQGGYGSYELRFAITPQGYSASEIVSKFNSNVDAYFTFRGCGLHLELNEICQLQGPTGNAPVQVIGIEANGWAFKSLPGHPEGANRLIRFLVVTDDVVGNAGRKTLIVNAWGPVSNSSLAGPFNTATAANISWSILANNINRFPPKACPGCV